MTLTLISHKNYHVFLKKIAGILCSRRPRRLHRQARQFLAEAANFNRQPEVQVRGEFFNFLFFLFTI